MASSAPPVARPSSRAARGPARPPAPRPVGVAVVAFEGISSFHLAVPGVVFGESLKPPNPFTLRICAAEPQPLRTSAGYQISGLASLRALQQAQIVVVPSWRNVAERPPQALLQALRAAHARGALVVGLCLGAHVLAEAGLLHGRRATTHWEYAREMAARFPQVQVQPDVLYVEDGGVMTSAGTAAGLDACLQIVRERLGAERANQAARRLVIPPHREGGQAQFIEQPLPLTAGGSRLARLVERVRERLHEPHDLDGLAAEARMSRRSFTRQFKALTGTSVLQWLLSERLQRAQQLLEQTDQSIERVAELAGFGSAEALRHHFRAAFDRTPTQWRRQFRG
ncbi:helix-turn-helix domain-containing protein [Inhella proteolytica]|uniref:Helix-turn-helix domain-containing protein n=1 Tax=Inhella proteolytica TaxID=2795029 RepID=A0A931NH93_9BURK|nr:helix-turn-helix domain-containing protein [Inhella proteolytica]MBH9576844.1 helix-turn-helix domain-containing protein [Inhella proteolytica]